MIHEDQSGIAHLNTPADVSVCAHIASAGVYTQECAWVPSYCNFPTYEPIQESSAGLLSALGSVRKSPAGNTSACRAGGDEGLRKDPPLGPWVVRILR